MPAVVQVTILGDNASLSKALATSETELAAFSKAAKAAGASMETAGRSLTHGITVPVLVAGAAAVDMAYKFQTNVQKVINLSQNFGQTAAQVSKTVLDVSTATGQGATDLADAYYKVAAAGYTGAVAQGILATGAKMAAVGMGDSATTTDALISVINVYGEANMSAAKAADIFTATVQNSKFAAADLAPVLGRVLPVAQQLGVSFQDLGGDLAALSHVGLSADSSVTGLTALFSNLIAATKGTGNAQKEMKALGLSAKSLMTDLGTKGSIATLDEIKTKLVAAGGAAQYTTAQWQDLATNMGMSLDAVKAQFGKIDLGKLQMLFPNKKAFLTFLGLTDENNQAAQAAAKNVGATVTGTLEKVFGQWSASDAGKMTMAINSVKNGLIELGDKLLPKVASAISAVAGWWDKLSTSQKNNIEHWALVAAEVGPVLLVMGKVVSVMGALAKVMDANPFILLGSAMAILYLNSTNFRNVVNELAHDLKPLLDSAKVWEAVLGAIAAKYAVLQGMKIAAWLTGIATAEGGVAAAGGAMAVTAATSTLGVLALGAGAFYAGDKIGTWLTSKITGYNSSAVDMSKMTQQITDDNKAMAQAFTDSGIPVIDLGYAFKALNDATASGADAANLIVGRLEQQGLTADQTKQALINMGVSADNAQAAVAGVSTAGADAQLAALSSHALQAAGDLAIAGAQAQAAWSALNGGTYGPIEKGANSTGQAPGVQTYQPPAPVTGVGLGGGGGGTGSASTAKAAAKKAATAAALAAAEANAAMQGKPLLNLEQWMLGGLQNTGKDGPVTTAAKALAAEIKKNFTVKGGTVPQAVTDAQAALTQLEQQASSFNSGFQTKLTAGADFVSVFKGTGASSGDIKAYLTQQVAGIQRLGSDLKILAKKGVPPNILQMLATAGVDGVDQADALVNASPIDLQSIIGLGTQITTLSQGIADSTEAAIFKAPTGLTAAQSAGQVSSKTTKDKKGHTITVTVNNADAAKIAKTIAQTLQNAS